MRGMTSSCLDQVGFQDCIITLGFSSFGPHAYPEVLVAVQAAQLPGLTVPPDVLGSGRKSFTLAPRFEEMKHLKTDETVKSLTRILLGLHVNFDTSKKAP